MVCSTLAIAPGRRSGPQSPHPTGIPAADRYPGTCRGLTARERADRRAAGRPPALRVRAEGVRLEFEDRLLGRQEGTVDDFVVRRNDGTPAYQLAVIFDDAAQGVGERWYVEKTSPTLPRGRSCSPGCSACRSPATPTSRSY